MKLLKTVGLAVAVSLDAAPWRHSRRLVERLQPARPRTCVRQTDLRMTRPTLLPH
jgi:hypothetical protein